MAREVGTEGKLGGQAEVPGVAGTWKDLTDSVNFMAGNLTSQVRNIAQVTTAVASGDLSQKITVEAKGEVAALADTINSMTDTLRAFADEVTRVAREVGTEGRLGGQAEVPGVSGTWKDLTDNVNQLAGNLTSQVRNIAQVTTAVAKGDLTQKITVDARGEILELKDTINTMVDQLRSFADEVTRVAREVGTEGRLGGQAEVRGVSGTWKDLTDNVNQLAGNLTSQVRNIAQVTTAVANGDLTQKITVDARGEILELKNTDQHHGRPAVVLRRRGHPRGPRGRHRGQARRPGRGQGRQRHVEGPDRQRQLHGLEPHRPGPRHRPGDHRRRQRRPVPEDHRRRAGRAARAQADDQHHGRPARRLRRRGHPRGPRGRHRGPARRSGRGGGRRGTWKDLTDNVNQLAGNLTSQVRNIAQVTTAVARGDLSPEDHRRRPGRDPRAEGHHQHDGRPARRFADEVTRVAREVGTEGALGGQAEVAGVSGTWKDLTDNVNQLAGNLTSQVRNIAQVTTAVANGDLTQKITVDARGEILELKDTINTMVDQLRSFADEVTRVAREVGTEGTARRPGRGVRASPARGRT